MKIGGASQILVVSSIDKIQIHALYLQMYPEVMFTLQKINKDLYGAIYESLRFAKDRNLFAMPDTVYPFDIFNKSFSSQDLWLGVFETDTPERFGVVLEDKSL